MPRAVRPNLPLRTAQVASSLVSRIDPRWIAGAGAALEVLAFWGYSRLDVDSGYVGGLLPWVVVQAVGMGLLFVPLTLTAVSRVDPADAGVGSAVLNTVQQVGGAVGIAVLGTVFANGLTERATELATADPPVTPALAAHLAQVHATSQTFGVALWLMVAAAVITLVGLGIRHQDLATDVTPGGPALAAAGSDGAAPPFVPPPREPAAGESSPPEGAPPGGLPRRDGR